MPKYIIEGGKKLEGTTYVSGSKNASLPIMAATILNAGTTKLYNILCILTRLFDKFFHKTKNE